MKKKLLLLMAVFSLTVIMCFYFRSKVNFSTFDERLAQTPYVQFDDLCYGYDEEKSKRQYQTEYTAVHSLEQLIEKSDFIAKVHFQSRQQKISVIETTVEVKEVYKGNNSQTITIYEPGYAANFYDFLTTYSSSHFIKEDCDYIVFLQDALPDQQNYYNYVNTLYSLYPIKDEILIKQLEYKEGDDSTRIIMEEYDRYDQFRMKFIDIEEMYPQEDIQDYYRQCEEYPAIAKQVYQKYLNQDIKFIYK